MIAASRIMWKFLFSFSLFETSPARSSALSTGRPEVRSDPMVLKDRDTAALYNMPPKSGIFNIAESIGYLRESTFFKK
ncbi:hypothetical protein SDC9_209616 [bioreactor metagenome]|uniref:Uncharacterized protein n=1 Tax=bioreactor metagenome TaxID=1076179 RepID=A0A645JE50_9ZZZZ